MFRVSGFASVEMKCIVHPWRNRRLVPRYIIHPVDADFLSLLIKYSNTLGAGKPSEFSGCKEGDSEQCAWNAQSSVTLMRLAVTVFRYYLGYFHSCMFQWNTEIHSSFRVNTSRQSLFDRARNHQFSVQNGWVKVRQKDTAQSKYTPCS